MFIGAGFIVEGVVEALSTGIDAGVRRANVVAGLLSVTPVSRARVGRSGSHRGLHGRDERTRRSGSCGHVKPRRMQTMPVAAAESALRR